MAKPALILVGADKGGVGKTTVARTLLDYFTAHNVPTRAFDTETPKGTLKRFHRDVSEVVDATAVADQTRIIDSFSATAGRADRGPQLDQPDFRRVSRAGITASDRRTRIVAARRQRAGPANTQTI
jgi:hypothetical protein